MLLETIIGDHVRRTTINGKQKQAVSKKNAGFGVIALKARKTVTKREMDIAPARKLAA